MEIYIDESGDLGFGPKASEYFIIAALIVRDKLPIRRCFKRIRRGKLRKRMKEIPEFKYNNTNAEVKRRVFQCLSQCDLDIGYTILRKRQVQPGARDNIHTIYKYLVYSLVTQIAAHYDTPQPITINIDKSLYGIRREDFDEYLIYKMMDNPHNGIIDKDLISIRHVASESESCIQAADFVAGAVNKRYRSDDGDHYHIIAHKMILEIDAFEDHKNKK